MRASSARCSRGCRVEQCLAAGGVVWQPGHPVIRWHRRPGHSCRSRVGSHATVKPARRVRRRSSAATASKRSHTVAATRDLCDPSGSAIGMPLRGQRSRRPRSVIRPGARNQGAITRLGRRRWPRSHFRRVGNAKDAVRWRKPPRRLPIASPRAAHAATVEVRALASLSFDEPTVDDEHAEAVVGPATLRPRPVNCCLSTDN